MRSPSISGFMALILLLAVNLASLRLLDLAAAGPQPRGMILLGLVPLLDATLIGLWTISRRYRITLERREDPKGCDLGLMSGQAATGKPYRSTFLQN